MIDRLMRSPMPVPWDFVVKNGSKDLFRQLRRKPYASITDRNKNLLVFSSLRLDDHLSHPIDILHRFDAVDDQIHRNLLQLHAVADDLRKVVCQFGPDRYVVSHCLVAQEGDGFSNDLVYIKNLSIRTPFSNCERILLMMSAARCASLTILVTAARTSSRSGFIVTELSQADVGVGDSATDWLTDFMSQGCRQLSHGCDPIDTCKIALRLA